MYDLRHSAACYWLPRYKSESALKYRFGWKRSEMIHYYTEFLGMKDTITEEDLCMDNEKNAYERRAEKAETENRQLQDEVAALHKQMNQILGVVERLARDAGHTPSSPPATR
jgi:FtsZ-binding cell division protein ZapB